MVREVWGRDAELTETARLLEDVKMGPVALVLTGEEGIGKTTLWKAVLSQAEDLGYRVLSARPVESEAKLAFAAVADLLRDGLDEALLALPPPQAAALEAALMRIDVEGSPDPKAVAFGFTGALSALARSRPLIVGVDDAQWLDAPSARVLTFALRRLEDVPIGVVLASRSEGPDPDRSAPLGLDAGPFEDRVHRVHLRPLGPEGLREILRSRLEVRFPRWDLSQIHEASGGNPLLTLELARALVRRGIEPKPGQPLPIPQRLGDLVTERLGVLPEAVRRLLLFVSASPEPTLPTISRAMGDPPALRDDVEAAVEADAVEISGEQVRFTSPLLGTVLYSGSSPEERRRVHARLAEVASDPEEQARHLALAADGPDENVAQVLEDAAQRARSRGAPDAAAQLAELARVLTPSDREQARIRRTSHAGRYAFESAQIERAEKLLQEAAAAASSGPMRAEALLYLSRVHYHRRDSMSASALAEEALREARDDPSLQASINLELGAAAELSGDHRTATARATHALELAERSGDRTITAESLSVVGFYDFLSGNGFPSERIQRAKSLQGAGPYVRPLRSPAFHEACMLMWSDDLAGARSRFRDLERRARDTGDESSLSVLLFMLSQIDSWTGDWAEAARLADESRAVAEWTGQRAYLVVALYAQALVESLRGNVESASALGERGLVLARETGSAQGEEFARSVLGFLELSRGDAVAADGWMSALVEALAERGSADPGILRFLPDEIEALIGMDEVGKAETLLSPFEEDSNRLGRRWAQASAARCRGLALAARRETTRAVEAFDRALHHHQGLEMPLEVGRTHLAKGKVLRRGKKWALARGSLTNALEIFDGLGAVLWADGARSELARIGGRPTGPNALTETESRVAELVATGLTNREVANRLFLSVSTVESNLSRAYRKLGVRSRAELSHKLMGSRAPEHTESTP